MEGPMSVVSRQNLQRSATKSLWMARAASSSGFVVAFPKSYCGDFLKLCKEELNRGFNVGSVLADTELCRSPKPQAQEDPE
eukprot:gene2514-2754_t